MIKVIAFYIDNINRGGAQRVIINLCRYYIARKAHVVLINDYPPDGKRPVYEIPNGVKRYYLQESYAPGFNFRFLHRIIRLRKIIRSEKPNLVLSFLGGPNCRLLLSSLGLHQKIVVSVRNDPNKEYFASGLGKWLVRKIFEKADGVVFQTDEAKEYFSKKVQDKSKIIFNPVDEKFYQVTRTPDYECIVTAGRMNTQKRHDILIDAFAMISTSFPNAKLYIYGEGPLREQLEQKVASLNLTSRVFMPGNVSNMDAILGKAGMFVLSSDYEGMPNALMEAMAAGVPCISTDCPCGGPMMLNNRSNAIKLVKCGDAAGLSREIEDFLSDNSLAEDFGKRAKKRAESFKPGIVLSDWDQYFSSIID